MKWINASEHLPDTNCDKVIYAARFLTGRNPDDVLSYTEMIILEGDRIQLGGADVFERYANFLRNVDWLDETAEEYPDQEADGVVFCGKCHKIL